MGNNHGTSVAGIIGANRNNGIGIAGISGGDSQLDPSNGGVSLYSIGVFSNNGGNATSDLIIEALDESSLATNTGYGNGINIGNHSYGTSNILNSPSLFDKEVQLAFEESWRQGVINIVARGNNGGVNSAEYPACYDDKFLINVVASGTDGKRKGISNGDYSDWQSSYGIADNPPSPGCHVDIMAPGVFELVSSTVNTDRILTYVEQNAQNDSICKIPFADQDNNMFSCFRGTSAATPHVTGAVSLMYSAHDPVNNSIYKNKLATEDVEHILEKTTYKTPNEYGLEDGYGLVNVEEAVKQSILPYSVYHLNLKLSNADIVEEAGIYQANNIRILKSHPGATPPYEKLGGPFTKKIRYRVKWNINFTPENGQIIDWWKLEARTNGGQPNGQLNSTNHWIMGNNNFYVSDGNSNATLGGNLNVNLNNTVTGTVEAYYYKFINTNPYYEQTLPANPNLDIHYTISLHLKGDDDLSIQDNANLDNIIIYPNPSNSEIMIRNLPENIDKYNVYIFNTSGVLVDSKKIGNASDIIDISKLSNGIYLIHLEADNYNTTSKFIKQ